MENKEAIEILRVNAEFVDAQFEDAINLAIAALEKQSRIITVTDVEGVLLASISNKDIVWTDRVRVIVSEEQDGD